MRVLLTILMLTASALTSAQEVFWARTIPTSPRILVVHGRNLWVGSEWNPAEPTATIGQIKLTFYRDGSFLGANQALVPSDEPNRALPEVLQFLVPDDVLPGQHRVDLIRNDGVTFDAKADVGAKARSETPFYHQPFDPSGEVKELTEPLAINGDFDGQGICYYADADFRGGSVLVVKRGSVRNVQVLVFAGASPAGQVVNAIDVTADTPVILERVGIRNESANGVGLNLTRCSQSTFAYVESQASRPFEAGPTARHSENTFYRCRAKNDRSWLTGVVGRAWPGDRNLIYECEWRGLDRGPVGQQNGPPLYRTLFYRCKQDDTGLTIGGSEGILWESIVGNAKPTCTINGTVVVVPFTSGQAGSDVKPGRFVMRLDNKKWAQIISSSSKSDRWELIVDRELGDGQAACNVGNAIIQNTVANSYFSGGKIGVYYFGKSIDNAIVGGQCRNVADCVVMHDGKDGNNQLAFDWGCYRREFVAFNCGRDLVRCAAYYDATKPPSQLPWLRLVP